MKSPRAPPLLIPPLCPQHPKTLLTPPPLTPFPWIWRCHLCTYTYRFSAALNRCLGCSHRFCRRCVSEVDYQGWERWGRYHRKRRARVCASTLSPRRRKSGLGGKIEERKKLETVEEEETWDTDSGWVTSASTSRESSRESSPDTEHDNNPESLALTAADHAAVASPKDDDFDVWNAWIYADKSEQTNEELDWASMVAEEEGAETVLLEPKRAGRVYGMGEEVSPLEQGEEEDGDDEVSPILDDWGRLRLALGEED